MGRDWFEELGGEEHKAEIVRHHLARIGLSLDDDAVKLAAPPDPPRPDATARLAAFDRREGFFIPHGGITPISSVLAEKLRYRPPAPMQPEGEQAADDDGYEGMRHG